MHSLGVVQGYQAWCQSTVCLGHGEASESDLQWLSSGEWVSMLDPPLYMTPKLDFNHAVRAM